jgi:exopolysaccharide biosynthesis protein
MKKLFPVFLLVLILVGLWLWNGSQLAPTPTSSLPPAPSEVVVGTPIPYQGLEYQVYTQKITSTTMSLIANFTAKKSSTDLIGENHCRMAVNGGYYTKENQPLGLFYTDERYYNAQIHSKNLTNGFVYQTRAGKFGIAADPPKEPLNFIFQTGPLLSTQIRLTIQDDEMARRILIGQTKNNEVYILALTEATNSNSGPRLDDIPVLLQKQPLQFTQLINLDGGSASVYYVPPTSLSEITPIGSLLCFL